MHLMNLFVLSLLTAVCLSSPTHAKRVLHERRDVRPENWRKISRASPDVVVSARIALVQNDIHRGHDLLMEIADPDSPKYGRHYSAQEVMNMFAPIDQTVVAVRDWLIESGIHVSRHIFNGYFIKFNASIGELEFLLATEYHIHQRHVDFVYPTIGQDVHSELSSDKRDTSSSPPGYLKPIVKPNPFSMDRSMKSALNLCDALVTPACIRALYDIPEGKTNATLNQLGIFQQTIQYDEYDINLFLRDYTNIPQGTFPVTESIDGGVSPKEHPYQPEEPLLDLDIATSLIYPQSIKLMQVGDNNWYFYRGFFDTWLDALDASYCTYEGGNPPIDPKFPDPHKGGYKGTLACGTVRPTNVISISYALGEQGLPLFYRQRQCYEYMKLSLQGTTFVFASGDRGVGNLGCFKPNSTKGPGDFVPMFPASCPYVLSVGATQILAGNSVSDPEVAVNDRQLHYYSGGGFSTSEPTPSYQKAAVSNYLNISTLPPSNKFNAAGRGIPDVSANGLNFGMFLLNTSILSGGTSMAAPIWASVLTLINEERLQAGKSPVGFVHPVLYKNLQAFHDITEGHNPGCGTKGFYTAPGWDPVTGLGTPNYPLLLKVFMALP